MENTATSQTPGQWPGAFEAYKPSKEAVHRSLATFVLLWVLTFVVSAILGTIFQRVFWLQEILEWVASAYFSACLVLVVLSSVRGKRMEIGEVLRLGWPKTLNILLLSILTGVTVVVSFLLLIIPGLFVLPRLLLAPYFLIDRNLGPLQAFKASWEETRGHSMKVWGIIGVGILMSLPIITVIGILLSVYLLVMYSCALGVLYIFIAGSTPAASSPPVSSPAKTDS